MHIQFKMLKVGIGTSGSDQQKDVYDYSSNSHGSYPQSYTLEQKGVYQEC